ncbi:hypothetical protein [Profundibacter sp.]|uniref:hypothetical protein n=1 Tax=Profundibacter sp. TaxID=3101071 RepID=UPI003D10B2ED
MKRLLAIPCLLALTAGPAFALSCARPTIEGSYLEHSQAKEHYILVFGYLTNKRNVVIGPEREGFVGTGGRSENFTATFIGHQGTRAGFDRPIKATVAISTTCADAWCGSVAMDAMLMTFLETTPYGHRMTIGPCSGSEFYTPTNDEKRSMLRCLRGGVCNPDRR